MSRFRYVVAASALQDGPTTTLPESLSSTLAACGGVPYQSGSEPGIPIVYVVRTGGTERKLAEMWMDRDDANEPVLLVTHARDNSLPAALEALAWWQQQGRRGQIVYLGGDDDTRLESALTDLETWHVLQRSRIGVAGAPSDWLIASCPDASLVRKRWGPEVISLDLAGAIEAYSNQGRGKGLALATSVRDGARVTLEPTPVTIGHAADLLPSLGTVLADRGLDAVTVRCFDLLEAVGTSGCLALAELNDRGFVAGCEGDVPSTLGMLWVKTLLGLPSWMANPARLDTVENTLLVAHCTIARTMVDSYALRTHFESGIGVAIAGDLPAGDYTLLRIGGESMDRIWLGEGTSTEKAPEEGLCRTQLEVRLDRGSVGDLLERPLGNHLVVVKGRHADRLKRWWETFIAPI
jgi:L-fucose isomerase-like protein